MAVRCQPVAGYRTPHYLVISSHACDVGDHAPSQCLFASIPQPSRPLGIRGRFHYHYANWLTYVWAVQTNRVVEASLGYFVFPLLSVLIGVLFLRERLRIMQWLAVGMAALGVLYLSILYGRLPWIALVLALTFNLYGLLKKMAPLPALHGLLVEAGYMLIPSMTYLAIVHANGAGAFASANTKTDMLLIGAGVITAIPLFLFSVAAQRLPFSTLGIIQYLAPTLAFLLGVFVYHESFDTSRLAGFSAVWIALGLFVFDGFTSDRSFKPHDSQPT